MTTEPVRFTLSSPVPTPPPDHPSILHIFERALRDVSLPIERAREIYNLQREIEFDLAEREYIRVRSLVEQELEPVARDASNPQTRSKYATLAQVIQAVRPIYSKHGIVVEFDSGQVPQDGWIRVLAFLSHESGYKRTFHIDMPADGSGAKGGAVMTRTHATGSAMTYGRRYLLLMIFNLAVGGEDDDGNAASRHRSNEELSDEQVIELKKAVEASGRTITWFCQFAHIDLVEDLAPERFDAALAYVKKLPKVDNAAGQ